MKRLRPTTQFKKDFKKFRRNPVKVAAFEKIAEMLMNEIPIPPSYKPHMLKGDYKGCMECHIEDDYLLIWIDGDDIDLLRIGSHSELFR